jgi:hypothetical protein
VRHRTSRYLNNRLEQDHRGIKSRCRPMLGLKSTAAKSSRSGLLPCASLSRMGALTAREAKWMVSHENCESQLHDATHQVAIQRASLPGSPEDPAAWSQDRLLTSTEASGAPASSDGDCQDAFSRAQPIRQSQGRQCTGANATCRTLWPLPLTGTPQDESLVAVTVNRRCLMPVARRI